MIERAAREIARRIALLPGRKALYRASHFLIRTARGDVRNHYESNGEKMIQSLAIRKAAAQPAIVFDVGANVGNWTWGVLQAAAEAHLEAHVHAFEPCQSTFASLASRYRGNRDVTLVQQACARSAGTALMRVYKPGAGTNSLAGPIDERPSESEEVAVTTVDLYCATAGIERIDLLKIDAEGYDLEVLAGASEMLDRKAIRIIQFEYNHRWIGARNYLKDAFSLLKPKGYSIGKLSGRRVEFYPRWNWELETWDEGNYACCPEGDESQFQTIQPDWLSSLTAESGISSSPFPAIRL